MATRLETLRATRDRIETQLDSGKDFIELEVRGKRVRRSDAIARLEYLNEQIRLEERKANARRRPARNRARLGRA